MDNIGLLLVLFFPNIPAESTVFLVYSGASVFPCDSVSFSFPITSRSWYTVNNTYILLGVGRDSEGLIVCPLSSLELKRLIHLYK